MVTIKTAGEYVAKILEDSPPKDDYRFGFPYMVYAFQTMPPYKLFLCTEDVLKLIEITRIEVMLICEHGRCSQNDLVLYYPELWMTKPQQQQFLTKLESCEINSVRIISNEPFFFAGLNRTQIVIIP